MSMRNPSSAPRVLIVGAGAVGAFTAWSLQKAGCHVACVCRSNYQQVKEHGFDMQSVEHDRARFIPDGVYASVTEAADAQVEKFDYVIVCTKALPERCDTADLVAPVMQLSQHTAVVLVQNGIGVEQSVAERFPHNPCISCVTIIGVTQVAPGIIKSVSDCRITAGPYNREDSAPQTTIEQVQELADLFTAGQYNCTVTDQIQLVRWNKLLWNASFGAVSILTGLHGTYAVLENDDAYRLISDIMEEVWRTAERIYGPKITEAGPYQSTEACIASTRNSPDFQASTLVDYINGRSMEVEVIFGNPVRIARQHGIDMPCLNTIYTLMRIASSLPRR